MLITSRYHHQRLHVVSEDVVGTVIDAMKVVLQIEQEHGHWFSAYCMCTVALGNNYVVGSNASETGGWRCCVFG
jgi:hypothetical protein